MAAPDGAPSPEESAAGEVTEDRLLGGRVLLRQPRQGALRASVDAVLLAAAIPARPGDSILEAGCGTGAAFLCLAARVPGLRVTAVERDPALAALARANARANGLAEGESARILPGDVRDLALARGLGRHAHALANPPWWPGGTRPPAARRSGATHEAEAGLADWAAFLAAGLEPGGTLTLILPAARFDAGIAALGAAGCGAAALLPLWPRQGAPARRVIVQARRARRGPARVLPGLALHGPGQAYTAEVEAILRDGAALPLTPG